MYVYITESGGSLPNKQPNPYARLQIWLTDRHYVVGERYSFSGKNREIEFSVVSSPSQGSDLLWDIIIHIKGPRSETLLGKTAKARGVAREEIAVFKESGSDKSVFALFRGVRTLEDHFTLDFPIPE